MEFAGKQCWDHTLSRTSMLESLPNISKAPFDIRAEVLANLIAQQLDLSTEQILHAPSYFHQRRGRKDVAGISEDFSHRLEKPLVRIDTTREGLYDILPESIFLRPEEQFGDDVRKTKALSEQEAKARQFLLPFEQLFFWLRIENEQREFDMENGLEHWWGQLLPLYKAEALDRKQKEILIQMIPHLQEIVGEWALTAQWIELLTGQKITISEEASPLYELPVSLQKRLGDGLLGQDFVLGSSYSDGVPAVRICLEELSPSDIIDYLPNGPKREILENEFLAYLMPLETPFSIELSGKASEGSFELSHDNENNVLGYTLFLQ